MRSQAELGEECGITERGAGARQREAFKKLRARVIHAPDFLVKPDVEKAFIKKYFEYHDIFADAKPVELDETTKTELQSILDDKKTEIEKKLESAYGIVINKNEEETKKLQLKDLELSTRAYNALNRTDRANIKTVGDIINLDEKVFYEIRNLGTATADEVIEKVHSLGLRMKWERIEEVKTGLLTIELGLSVRSYNCLARAGLDNVDDIIALDEKKLIEIRNLGRKSADEVIKKIHSLGLKMKGEEDKANTDAELVDVVQELKTAYSDFKAKDKECDELKKQVKESKKRVQDNLESTKSSEINPNEKSETSEDSKPRDDSPAHDEL